MYNRITRFEGEVFASRHFKEKILREQALSIVLVDSNAEGP